MAVGDPIIYVFSGASSNIQPPVGEHWLVTHLGVHTTSGTEPNHTYPIRAELKWTGNASYYSKLLNTPSVNESMATPYRIFINSDHYLYLATTTGSSYYWDVMGVKI